MGTFQSKAIGVGAFFLLILLSGFWLSRSGRPLNSMIFAIHKLIAVAVVIFLVVSVHRTNQVAGLSPVAWIAAAVTALCFLSTIATGGLLSINDEVPAAVLRMHQITPYLTVLSTVWLLWQISPAQQSLAQ
jgi:uncharacterized membrane protein (GlpM family)